MNKVINKVAYQTISTKVLPATSYKPTRIKAQTLSGAWSITVCRDIIDADNDYQVHCKVVHMLLDNIRDELGERGFRWAGPLAGGETKDGYVFVFVK
jgi:hypothetical protein